MYLVTSWKAKSESVPHGSLSFTIGAQSVVKIVCLQMPVYF